MLGKLLNPLLPAELPEVLPCDAALDEMVDGVFAAAIPPVAIAPDRLKSCTICSALTTTMTPNRTARISVLFIFHFTST